MITFKKKPNTSKQVQKLLHPIVKKWFFSKFKDFSPPQLYGVMEVHSRSNILVSAPTGSGKTITAFLSILNELVDCAEKGILQDKIYACYLSPLKALNNDIEKNLIEPLAEMEAIAGKSFGIRVAIRTGDTTAYQKQKMLKNAPHVLITTPESAAILLSSTKFSEHLKHVEWTIVDEIHSIAENKRGVHLSLTMERLQRLSPGMCRIGLSATVAPLDLVAQYLVGSKRSCKIIDVQFMKNMQLEVISPVPDLVNTSYETVQRETYKLMDKLIQEHKTTLIFTNTRAGTERTVHHLKDKFPDNYYEVHEETNEKKALIGAHHGSLSKEHRLQLENDLRDGKMKAVVCLHGDTDVLTGQGFWKKIKYLKKGESVQSLGEDLKIGSNTILNTFKTKNEDKLISLRTCLGKEITATKGHKFLTINSQGGKTWKEAQNIKEGDYVASARSYSKKVYSSNEIKDLALDNFPDTGLLVLKKEFLIKLRKEIQISGPVKDFWRKHFKPICSYSSFREALAGKYAFRIQRLRILRGILGLHSSVLYDSILSVTSDKKRTKRLEINSDFMRILGFMSADGYISWRGLYLTNRNKVVLEYYRNLVKKLAGYSCFEKESSSGTPVLCWESTFVAKFVSSLGFFPGRKARILRIPDFIFRLPVEMQWSFLSGYFDGDGYVELKSADDRVYAAGISTTSKDGAHDIQRLLLQLGVSSSIRSRYVDEVQTLKDGHIIHKKGWFYDVVGEHLRIFAKCIEPVRKNISRVKEVLKINGYCNIDIIPNLGKILRQERKGKGISNYKLFQKHRIDLSKYELGNRNITRKHLKRIYKLLKLENTSLFNLAKSDLFWERVVKVTESNVPKYVYNIEVAEDHNYIANGFVTKNCSTSLELGLDIGYIDLVICVGSPKSVARLLQRIGRAGHKLHETVNGKILVQDRDDLVECSVMLKNAVEKKMDRIHIPTNALDVLAQQTLGMALEEVWDVNEMYKTITASYCYSTLSLKDFHEVLDYLAGNFISLEDRHIYARIWWDKDEQKVGKKGKMTRVIYMTNIGTIPDSQGILVKNGQGQRVGKLDEGFLEKLGKGDIFVLGGNTYQFNYARGMVAQVTPMPGKKPTVPSWYSDRLPLSYDLACSIQHFRSLMEEKLRKKRSKKDILQFVHDFLYVDQVAAEALYNYMKDQYDYVGMPHERQLLVEHYRDEQMKNYVVFHTLYGRRVNDALSRALAYAIARSQHKDVEVGISDNGFYVSYDRNVNVQKAFSLLKTEEFRAILEQAIDKSQVLKRRFRHCAGRALMILRNYGGNRKRVGRQQVSSMILMSAVRRISEKFFILRETRREILEDVMDVEATLEVLQKIENKELKIKEVTTFIPSPFALNLVMQGYSDILHMEDRQKFVQRMHQMVQAKIALKQRHYR